MPRVYSQKAAKDYPAQGIKKGIIYLTSEAASGSYLLIKSVTL